MKRGEKRDYNCGWVVEARVRGQSPKASSQLTSKGTLPTQGQPEGRDESRRRSPTWSTGGEGALGLAFSAPAGEGRGPFPTPNASLVSGLSTPSNSAHPQACFSVPLKVCERVSTGPKGRTSKMTGPWNNKTLSYQQQLPFIKSFLGSRRLLSTFYAWPQSPRPATIRVSIILSTDDKIETQSEGVACPGSLGAALLSTAGYRRGFWGSS